MNVIGTSSILMILRPMTTYMIELVSSNHFEEVATLITVMRGYIPLTNPF